MFYGFFFGKLYENFRNFMKFYEILPRNNAQFDIFDIFVEHDRPFSNRIRLCLFCIHTQRFEGLFDERNLCILKYN